MKRALFAYNPMSGNRFISQHLDSIINHFQQLDVLLTVYRIPKDDEYLKELLNDEYDFIIGSGGDGTIAQVVKNIINSKNPKPLLALGSGTCNNFTKNMDISQNMTDDFTANKIIDEVYFGDRVRTDVGKLDTGDIFLTSFAGGAFTQTSYETNKNLKMVLGPLAYYLKPISELPSVKPFKLYIECDGTYYEENVYMFLLLNGKSVGNFDNFITLADLMDGKMELILIKESNPLELANLWLSILKSEDITGRSNVSLIRGQEFKIWTDEPMGTSLDGEKGPSLPISIKVIPKAIEIFVPKGLNGR